MWLNPVRLGWDLFYAVKAIHPSFLSLQREPDCWLQPVYKLVILWSWAEYEHVWERFREREREGERERGMGGGECTQRRGDTGRHEERDMASLSNTVQKCMHECTSARVYLPMQQTWLKAPISYWVTVKPNSAWRNTPKAHEMKPCVQRYL